MFEPEDYRNVSLPDTLDAMDSLIKQHPGALKGEDKGTIVVSMFGIA